MKVVTYSESIRKPKLWEKVSLHLGTYRPFHALLPQNAKLTKFGKDIFEGDLNYVPLSLRRKTSPRAMALCTFIMVVFLLASFKMEKPVALVIMCSPMAPIIMAICTPMQQMESVASFFQRTWSIRVGSRVTCSKEEGRKKPKTISLRGLTTVVRK